MSKDSTKIGVTAGKNGLSFPGFWRKEESFCKSSITLEFPHDVILELSVAQEKLVLYTPSQFLAHR